MRRRKFITLLGGTAVWPLAARAQQAERRMRRIGILVGSAENDRNIQGWISAFQRELEALGWKEGRDVRFERRFASGDPARAQQQVSEIVQLNPDTIFTSTTPSALTLVRGFRTIPVVFANLSDPVRSGVVASLAQPGGNATGFTNFEDSIGGKWLEILQDFRPDIKRTSLLFNPAAAPYASGYIDSLKAAAGSLSVQAIIVPVNSAAEIDAALAIRAREPGGGAIVLQDIFTVANRHAIIAASLRHRVPVVYPYRVMAADGGLVAYGPDIAELYRRAATYVDRILKGAKPSELPVQQPIKFELAINLRTAKALGLTVPPTLLARADEVIE